MRIALTGALLACVLASEAAGQRLYRKDMDTAAQAAVKAMEKVDSKDLFNRMLGNLSIQSKQDLETAFSGMRRVTRGKIQRWDTWCTVHQDLVQVMKNMGYSGFKTQALLIPADTPENMETELRSRCAQLLIQNDLSADPDAQATAGAWAKALKDLAAQMETVKGQLAALKMNAPAGDPFSTGLLSHLGDLTEVQTALDEFGNSSNGAKLKALTQPALETLAILKSLGAAYQDYQDRVGQINQVKQELKDLQAEMLKIALQKLVAEEQHLQRLMAIETRRAHELEDAVSSFEQYRIEFLCEKQRRPALDLQRIDDSIRELGQAAASDTSTPTSVYLYTAKESEFLDPKKEAEHLAFCAKPGAPARLEVESLSRALFQAAAVQDRGAAPALFAELRRAQEEQRYSIVQSSLEARAYETLVNTGVRRLALLHAGGIKPEQIAQLVFQAGQLAGVSVIAAKQ